MSFQSETILVLDFGSQYTQLVARRVREQNVYSVIYPYRISTDQIRRINPQGIIFSGSPANVYQTKAPLPDPKIFELGIPILGICYGLQCTAHLLGGQVKKVKTREYGYAKLHVSRSEDLFKGLTKQMDCWMSHGDQVSRLPKGFERIAHTSTAPVASFRHREKKIYGVQFHPEVAHTPLGSKVIRNFLCRICGLKGNWTPKSFIQESVREIRNRVGKERVVLGLSGGVDSSVTGILIHRAIGEKLTCIFVDNGLLRLNERKRVDELFKKNLKMDIRIVQAEDEFLRKLHGVKDPEQKRKIIGRTFIKVFEREAKKLGHVAFLAQGTLYPDVIESVSFHGGPTATIKSHHNVGGLPKRMRFKLLEPLRALFKDEVRRVGRALKLPSDVIDRHPFPGPGLAVRILGDITKDRCDLLRKADWIVMDEIKKAGLYRSLWQSFGVLLPVKSVGVMGDERTYEHVLAIRAVNSQDGMTADWAKLPYDLLGKMSNRIINEVPGINRVCYDISSKPPATIEWE